MRTWDSRRSCGWRPKDYARPALDKQRLGELIDSIGTIGLGDAENRSKDVLGRVCEYFLSSFASAEGKKGGQFYTPRCVVRVMVEMLAPYKGRVYDPCCGSAGMFVQSEKFVEEHGGRIGEEIQRLKRERKREDDVYSEFHNLLSPLHRLLSGELRVAAALNGGKRDDHAFAHTGR